MIFLGLDYLVVVFQVVINIGYPLTLRIENLLSRGSIDHLPLLEKLVDSSKLCCDRWNSESFDSPIILVASNGDSHHLLRGTGQSALRKLAIADNVLKDTENSRTTTLNVILCHPIEWIDKSISIRVGIDYKVEFSFVLSQKLGECYSLRL